MYTEGEVSLSREEKGCESMLSIRQKKDILIRIAFGACILTFIYLFFGYLLPILFPFVVGFLVAYGVVQLGDRIRPGCRWLRMLLAIVIDGGLGTVVTLAAIKGVSALSGIVTWLPDFYELKIAPLAAKINAWFDAWVLQMDPNLGGPLEVLSASLMSAVNNLFAAVSEFAVDLLSGMVTGVPSVVLSMLAMIISTFFVAADYERIREFLVTYTPENGKALLTDVRLYFTDTLFVVIRSYLIIMLLTFTELSVLFSVFRISSPFAKAAIIAVFDIMPILGTGGILIPWGITSLVLGYTALGVEVLVIYGIITVVRNYVEPKIVGAQLGLHPIITLVSMFVGLRLFGFWGMFGIPVAISYFWKKEQERSVQNA